MIKINLSVVRAYHLFVVLGIVLILVALFALDHKFRAMKQHCELMGGKFYSISFTENICVDGERVILLD